MILESIVTTRNADRTCNVAPMGPHVNPPDLDRFELRPFQSSATYHNLDSQRCGVLHVTDDVLLFAQTALNGGPETLDLADGHQVDCQYLPQACRVYEFEVTHVDAAEPRALIQCRTVYEQHLREFLGFNRARHLVLEATILATRIDFVPPAELMRRISEYAPVIEKTGGERERAALELLRQFAADCDPARSTP